MNMRNLAICMTALLLAGFPGCKRQPEPAGPQFGTKPASGELPVYHFAVHPLYNPSSLITAYQPLIDYINSRLQGARLAIEASRDYANFEEKYLARRPEFILPNPWQTLQAQKVGYRVIAMAGEPNDFKGLFIVRKDGGIRKPADLKGKPVSYPSPTALAACIMPQYFLYSYGINVNTDIENRYVGSQESSIRNVYLKLTSAGATWPPPWRLFQKNHPEQASELIVIWETPPLVNNSVMVRNDIPAGISEQVRKLLLELNGSMEGKSILSAMETARFLPAADNDYDVVRQYVARFERDVRPVIRK